MSTATGSFWAICNALAAHLQLFIGHVLAQLLGHALEVLEGDLAGFIIIKEPECLGENYTGFSQTAAKCLRVFAVLAIPFPSWQPSLFYKS